MNNVLLFTTTLFVDGNPVRYEIFKEAENKYLFKPSEGIIDVDVPVLHASYRESKIKVEGTSDQDLIDQIVEDLSNFLEG